MPRQDTAEIYMIKKSAEGFVVCFRAGTERGIRPGMRLAVVNEDGFHVGTASVLASTEVESEARVESENVVTLGCRVSIPQPPFPG